MVYTHGSKTSRVMYSLGMRGSWWENTFWSPTSHIKILLLGFWFREFPITWNSITPRRSSRRAASSRAEWADSRLVWKIMLITFNAHHCYKKSPAFLFMPVKSWEKLLTSAMAAGSAMVDMTSLMRSMGMSPTTLGLLFSSWVRGSVGFRFSPTTTHRHRGRHSCSCLFHTFPPAELCS